MATMTRCSVQSCAGSAARTVSCFTRPCLPAPARQCTRVHAEPTEKPGGQADSKPSLPEEMPPWVRREKERELQAAEAAAGAGKLQLPIPLALLFSTFTAIAATGSIFEYVDRNPIFGVIQPDNPLWAPILLFMAITGYPLAGFLFKYGVDGFNAEAERQDKIDGYLPNDRK